MRVKNYIVIVVFFILSINIYSQNKKGSSNRQGYYSDYVADESGKRLEGITVRVRGNSSSDITDVFGEFTVQANKGDLIILSRGGVRISSYVYDGSLHYEVLDNSEEDKVSENKRIKRKPVILDTFKINLDSANYYVNHNATKSIKFIEQALKNTNSKKEIAKAYEILGDNYINLKQYDLAKSNYEAAKLSLKKSIPLQLKLAKAYYLSSDLINAEKLYKKVLKNKKITFYQRLLANEGLGKVYKNLKKYDWSLANFKSGFVIAEENLISPKITSLNNEMADVLDLQGNKNQSEIYYNNSITSAKNENREKAIVQSNRTADFYGRTNNINKEIKLRKQNLQDFEEAEIDEIVIDDNKIVTKQSLKLDIGNAFNKQKKYKEAINYFEESAKDANALNDIETEREAIQGLTDVYVAIGDDNNALFNYKKLHDLTDLIYKQKEEKLKNLANISNELLENQTRINSLELDRKLNESKLKLVTSEQDLINENSKRQKLIIYSLLGGLLLLLLSLFYMLRANKQRKLANNLLALKSLRSQMNPHFIFNALNSVNSFIANNDERTANRYLTNFSTLMRSVLENSEQDFIPLEKEIQLLGLYLELEHTRFKDKFDFEVNIDKEIQINEFQIPPMLLQPYIENAIWHGLRYKKEKGLLQINVNKINKESIEIAIIDNGIGREESKALKSKNQLMHKSKGMQNIKQRVVILNEMYKDKVDVYVNDLNEDKTGTKVMLILKKD